MISSEHYRRDISSVSISACFLLKSQPYSVLPLWKVKAKRERKGEIQHIIILQNCARLRAWDKDLLRIKSWGFLVIPVRFWLSIQPTCPWTVPTIICQWSFLSTTANYLLIHSGLGATGMDCKLLLELCWVFRSQWLFEMRKWGICASEQGAHFPSTSREEIRKGWRGGRMEPEAFWLLNGPCPGYVLTAGLGLSQ